MWTWQIIVAALVHQLAWAAHANDPIIATYDASGKSPQCSQGKESYMRNCVFPSDFYFYIVAERPVFGKPGISCTDMGWNEAEHIFHGQHDPIFHGFDGYWHGGDAVFGTYDAMLHKTHDPLGDIGQYLAASRDYNPACSLPGPPAPKVLRRSSSLPMPDANATAVLYDSSGAFGQCLEAPYLYLRDCIVPSDFFTFFLSHEPVLESFNRTCEQLGYTAADTSSVFAGAKGYWKGGQANATQFMAGYRAGHPNINAFLARTRDGNPACSKQ
eukprot:g2497.t1